ncbi:MAG: rhodanese-like domain-containing protein [Saprospiraceae bacterium]|nr:rhodanese-like domain-containing protein [Saprospiraceae bacterium]
MKWGILLIMFAVSATMVSCQQANATKGKQEKMMVSEVVPTERFAELMDTIPEYQLIDVRTPQEFEDGHLDGAVNIDYYSSDFAEQLSTLKRDVPVLVYCRSGGRSAKASAMMRELDFETVYDMQGGFMAWTRKMNR